MNLINSFSFAIKGIVSSFKSERNMKIHTVAMILVIILGFVFKISIQEWTYITISIALVIGAEVFNTAIETSIDLITKEQNELAGRAKDLAAGAVLIFAISSLIVGALIFIPKILEVIK